MRLFNFKGWYGTMLFENERVCLLNMEHNPTFQVKRTLWLLFVDWFRPLQFCEATKRRQYTFNHNVHLGYHLGYY